MNIQKRMVALLCAGALVLFGMAGCTTSSQGSTATEAQSENRQFMSQVNQTMEELGERLSSFDEAVARGDVVTMRSAADNAFKSIASLEAIEAPEAMTDIKQKYVDGCNALKDALNAYIDLYAEVESATDEAPFDYDAYDERIAGIQEQYNQGIALLEEADKAATEA